MTLPKDGWIYWTKSASFLVADASWKLWWDTERQIRLKCGGHFPHHKDIDRSIHQSHRVKYDEIVNGFPQRVSVVSTLFDHVIMWSCYCGFHLGPKKCRHTQTTKLVPLGLAYSCYSYLGIECSNTWTWDQDQAGWTWWQHQDGTVAPLLPCASQLKSHQLRREVLSLSQRFSLMAVLQWCRHSHNLMALFWHRLNIFHIALLQRARQQTSAANSYASTEQDWWYAKTVFWSDAGCKCFRNLVNIDWHLAMCRCCKPWYLGCICDHETLSSPWRCVVGVGIDQCFSKTLHWWRHRCLDFPSSPVKGALVDGVVPFAGWWCGRVSDISWKLLHTSDNSWSIDNHRDARAAGDAWERCAMGGARR